MSSIVLDFTIIDVPEPHSVSDLGGVTIDLTYNGTTTTLTEILTSGPAFMNFFEKVPYGAYPEDVQQAENFAAAFNRDWRNVFGNGNLQVTTVGNVVTIESTYGDFSNFNYDGIVLNISDTIDNAPAVDNPDFEVTNDGTGDCNYIDYTATALNGNTGPYRLQINGATEVSGWNGSAYSLSLRRGEVVNVVLYDDSNTEIGDITLIIPRKLAPGEYKPRTTQYVGYSDVVIDEVNPVAGTGPVEYSLDGTSYSTNNTFPGLLPGLYTLYVRDIYGCVITRSFELNDYQDPTTDQVPPYFLVSDANSLIFNQDIEEDKNYFNTRSCKDLVIGRARNFEQHYYDTDTIGTQFKSSFPYHIVTMFKSDGTKQDLSFIMIQENLGFIEKVDCEVFPINGKTGVYFDGGNKYEPNTTTVTGASEYDTYLPNWAVEGQIVNLGGYGAMTIDGTGYDENRGFYFTVAAVTPSETTTTVQVTYNLHPYNLFEFYFNVSGIPNTARIVIEYGYDFNNIAGRFESEVIRKVQPCDKYITIRWGDEKNRGNMVYQSGIEQLIRLKAEYRAVFATVAEAERGPTKATSLNQSAYLGFRLRTGAIIDRMANKLNIASGTLLFEVNGVRMVRGEDPSVEPIDNTNLYTWQGTFDYGGDELGIKPDELVLDFSTGNPGGGGTGQGGVPALGPDPVYDGKTRVVNVSGEFFVYGGNFVTLN